MSKKRYYITINHFNGEDHTCCQTEDADGITVYRRTKLTTSEFIIGDQIAIGHYTATCQWVDEKGALFLMDQYDDDPQRMNDDNSNEGGYEKSDLRRRLNNEESLKSIPDEIRKRMVPFENGDLIRIPTVEEIFGEKECKNWCESLGGKQLPLMVDRKNRIAFRKNNFEWGWLQNKILDFASIYANVYGNGLAVSRCASLVTGVRRALLIK